MGRTAQLAEPKGPYPPSSRWQAFSSSTRGPGRHRRRRTSSPTSHARAGSTHTSCSQAKTPRSRLVARMRRRLASPAVAALDAYRGHERRVDVGWANDRLFLNNVSLGAYARLVHRREHHRRRREALAQLRALAIVARDREPLGLSVDGRPV